MKYIKVYQQIKRDIQQEVFSEGQKIPSLRILAQEYHVSLDTIKKAINLLVEDQLIYSKNRSGYYVLQKEKISFQTNLNSVIDFGSSRSNVGSFPYSDFMLCLKKATENYKEDFFQYGKAQGLPELIQTMKIWFESQQLYTQEQNLFITTGTQQALYILSRLRFPNKKNQILIELPGYHLMLDLLKLEKIPFVTIERDTSGVDWNLLESYFRDGDIKYFYTTPRISSPLGLSYSEKEKKRLIELAQIYNVYLIEDDYLGDFISDSTNLPLHYYDMYEKVIYLKSFSKVMFPGLRLGACILPSVLRESFIDYRRILEVDSSMFSQAALNLYIKTGMFDNHVKEIQRKQQKNDEAFKASARNSPDLYRLSLFQTGKSFLTLPNSASVSTFEKHLKSKQVNLEDVGRNVPENYHCQGKLYTIELLQLTPKQIRAGMAIIEEAYQQSIRN